MEQQAVEKVTIQEKQKKRIKVILRIIGFGLLFLINMITAQIAGFIGWGVGVEIAISPTGQLAPGEGFGFIIIEFIFAPIWFILAVAVPLFIFNKDRQVSKSVVLKMAISFIFPMVFAFLSAAMSGILMHIDDISW